jgi:SAM-dependent methyltransferase
VEGREPSYSTSGDADQVTARTADYVARLSDERPVQHVLDAGAGRDLPFSLPASAELTGIDISEQGLEENDRLDIRIVGDLQTCELPSAHYDVIVCWNVLEHLSHPLAALVNLRSALRPGGAMILSVPNVANPKGSQRSLRPTRSTSGSTGPCSGIPTPGARAMHRFVRSFVSISCRSGCGGRSPPWGSSSGHRSITQAG